MQHDDGKAKGVQETGREHPHKPVWHSRPLGYEALAKLARL